MKAEPRLPSAQPRCSITQYPHHRPETASGTSSHRLRTFGGVRRRQPRVVCWAGTGDDAGRAGGRGRAFGREDSHRGDENQVGSDPAPHIVNVRPAWPATPGPMLPLPSHCHGPTDGFTCDTTASTTMTPHTDTRDHHQPILPTSAHRWSEDYTHLAGLERVTANAQLGLRNRTCPVIENVLSGRFAANNS